MNRFPKVLIGHVDLRVLTQQFFDDILVRVDGREMKWRHIFVAECFLRDRSRVKLVGDILLDKSIVMQLVETIVLELHARSNQELDKLAVASPCDLSDRGSDSVFTVRINLATLSKVGHRESFEERNGHGPEDFVLGVALEQIRDVGLTWSLVHKGVVALTVASSHLHLADVCAVCLLANEASVDLLHQIGLDARTLVNEELLHVEITTFLLVFVDCVAELLHHLDVRLVCENLKRTHRLLGAPWQVERRNVLVVMHDPAKKELVVGQDRAHHVPRVALETALELHIVAIVKFLDFLIDDFSVRVPSTNLELGWLLDWLLRLGWLTGRPVFGFGLHFGFDIFPVIN